MTTIEQIWLELEADNSVANGLLLRRYSPSVLPELYVSMVVPEKHRSIAASVNNHPSLKRVTELKLRDIKIEVRSHSQDPEKRFIVFILQNPVHRDVFSILCEDLMYNVGQLNNADAVLKELLNRFEKWRSLFEKASLDGLTPEEQCGLFGETYFLRKFLQRTQERLNIILSWAGPEREIRDYQFGTWSVEVKATLGNNHQKVQISNERQLDTREIDNLYLFHLSLERRTESGETLNQLIDSVCGLLVHDAVATNSFRAKLLEYGYFENHRNLYEQKGYHIRDEQFYRVDDDFPRIEENMLMRGVGDVKYSIIVSMCTQFRVDESEVFTKLIFV